MATGIPRKQSTAPRGGDVVLQYDGKRSADDILRTPRPELTRVWSGDALAPTSGAPNRLYHAENLGTLLALADDSRVRNQVRLVYIDPPFATRSVFQSRQQVDAYTDLLVGAEYLEFLRQRLIVLRELLADDGSIYVHLDETMASHAKVLMDEIFGRAQFRNLITRKKCNPKNYTRHAFGNVADFILFYTKSDRYVWNRPIEPWTPERAAKEYQYVDAQSGRRYKKVPLHAPGVRRGATGQPWRGVPPPPGKHWQYPPATLDEFDARGDIYWSASGNPRRKVYLDQSDGVAVQDLWLGFRDAHNQHARITGYPTEKNPDLLERIIGASSNAGDLVLDGFSGSGTTLAVSERLGRRWIGIDTSPEALATTLRRFARGTSRMGDFVGAGEPVVGRPASNSHETVTRFELWTEAATAAELNPIVAEWRAWLAASRVPDPPTGQPEAVSLRRTPVAT